MVNSFYLLTILAKKNTLYTFGRILKTLLPIGMIISNIKTSSQHTLVGLNLVFGIILIFCLVHFLYGTKQYICTKWSLEPFVNCNFKAFLELITIYYFGVILGNNGKSWRHLREKVYFRRYILFETLSLWTRILQLGILRSKIWARI